MAIEQGFCVYDASRSVILSSAERAASVQTGQLLQANLTRWLGGISHRDWRMDEETMLIVSLPKDDHLGSFYKRRERVDGSVAPEALMVLDLTGMDGDELDPTGAEQYAFYPDVVLHRDIAGEIQEVTVTELENLRVRLQWSNIPA